MINMHLLYFNASYKTGLAAILMPIAAEQRSGEHYQLIMHPPQTRGP